MENLTNLASRHLLDPQSEFNSWGQSTLLGDLLAGPTPLIVAFDWVVTSLVVTMTCAIASTGRAPAFVLRVVLTPEFLWVGLHRTALSVMELCKAGPADLVSRFPPVSTSALATPLACDEKWIQQTLELQEFLSFDMTVGCGHPEDVDMDLPPSPPAFAFPEAAATGLMPPPPPARADQPRVRRRYRDDGSVEYELDHPKVEERSTSRLDWVPGNQEYGKSDYRPTGGGLTSGGETPPWKRQNGVVPYSLL
ncbi:hypothetical protein N7520_002868 [Penicillium odoratum]|uniref:uncharacterized protein n=1 Tax=Penicillium odoratum TaxID=1167516 RepID=UPI00254738CF|nr:uncharacterized protein N7520_002868 [Penicillium odoratum]KAJ5772339.1 hypothetical protein N7520_002868 [Penicillium odoratum]